MSSLQEARNLPWNDFTGLSWFSWQTWICLSVEQEAKLSSDFQSTSRAGAEWKANCCLQLPVAASQIIVVLSTPALRMKFPVKFQIPAVESPEPEASRSCLGFQAQMNTSLSCPF